MKERQTTKKILFAFLAAALLVLSAGQVISAQSRTTTAAPERGYTPGKSYAISDIENIGLYGGNLMFNVPLGSLPAGRGGIGGGINLRYDSKIWDNLLLDSCRFETCHDLKTLIPSDEGGWRFDYKYTLKLEYLKSPADQGSCNSSNPDSFYPHKLQMVLPDGSKHALYSKDYMNAEGEFMRIFPDGRSACPNGAYPAPVAGTITYFTTDGTFLRLDVLPDGDSQWENNTWTLYSPDGATVVHSPASGIVQRITDRNGNYVDVIETAADSAYFNHRTTYLQDQLGRRVVIEYNAAVNEDWIHAKGVGGEVLTTKVRWKSIGVNKFYYASEMAPSPLPQNYYENYELNGGFRVVDKVFLPAQVSGSLEYKFEYNVDSTSAVDVGWGEVSKVTLPSGAEAAYSYYYDNVSGWNPSTGGARADGILNNRPMQKQLLYNKEYDAGSIAEIETWTYTPTAPNNDLSMITEVAVTAPDGGTTREFYALDSINVNPPAQPDYVKGEVYKTQAADGSLVEKFYRSNVPIDAYPLNPYHFNKANRYVKYEFASLANAAGSPAETAIREYSRDKNGNVTEVREFEYIPYSSPSIPRNSFGRVYALPQGITPARISKTDYFNDTPEASSTIYNDADSYYLAGSPRLLNLVKSSEVQNGAGVPQTRSEITYDHTFYAANTKGGNPTVSKAWDSFKDGVSRAYSNPLTAANSISTATAYNSYGSPTLATDAKGNQTQITYGSINGFTDLYPTQTVAAYGTAIARTATAQYDFYTGLVTSSTDVDNNLTSGTDYDALGRPLKVKTAVGTPLEVWSQTEYDDVNRRVTSRSDLYTKGDGKKVATQFYDQLGRVRLTKSLEDATTQSAINETDGIKVQTRYLTGNPNSYQLTSNPYRAATSAAASSEPSMGWTQSKSINTGKHAETETFVGAGLPTAFGGNNTNSTGVVKIDLDADRTLVTDQAGKQRISRTNALGQLTDVWEITAAEAGQTEAISFGSPALSLHGLKTGYSYNTLSNLTTVLQGGQTRSFTYSSLSRLKSATNPESGLIQYQYDNNGNLTKKTDARLVETNYGYDALNRVILRSYTAPAGLPNYQASPNVAYTYDNLPNAKGKLTKVSSATSTTEYTAFDILGRVTAHKQTTDGTPYTTGYGYNLSGGMIEETYPSTRVVKNVLDNDGDLALVQSKKNGNSGYFNYAKSFSYTAAGALSSMQMGNGKWESTVFNSRLQPTQIALGGTQNATNLLKLNFAYNTANSTTDNNGNVISQTITTPSETHGNTTYPAFVATQVYTYDSLNRLKSAEETSPTQPGWRQHFLYDRFGNRNFDTASDANGIKTTTLPLNCATAVCNPAVDPNTNKLIGYAFDNAGNTKTDANGQTFIYDGENHQTEVTQNNITLGRYYYDGDGKRVKKIALDQSTQQLVTTIFVYDAGGKLVAEYANQIAASQQVSYLTSDHLGSPRINTDQNGVVISRHDYHPFGEEVVRTGYSTDDIREKFATYERDTETGLDFAQSRYFNSGLGRFISPDSFTNDTRVSDPQSWNLFTYVRNNPLNMLDPLGKKGRIRYWTDSDGVTHVSLEASFAIYGAKGQNVSEEDKNAFKAQLVEGVEEYLAKNFKIGGRNFEVTTNVTAMVVGSESEAIESGSDNIVEIGNRDLASGGDSATVGVGFGVAGESFDRMVVEVDGGDFKGIGRLPEQIKNVIAHEFGAHLLGARHSLDEETTSIFNGSSGDTFLDSDFNRLMTGKSTYLPPPPPLRGMKVATSFGIYAPLQSGGLIERRANSSNNESPSSVYTWKPN